MSRFPDLTYPDQLDEDMTLEDIAAEKSDQDKTGEQHRIFDETLLSNKVKTYEKSHSKIAYNLMQFYRQGAYRPIQQLNDWNIEALKDLKFFNSNFEPLIQDIENQLAITNISKSRAIRFNPTLLISAPGYGKSYICRKIGEALDLPVKWIDCSKLTSSFELTGNNSSWSDSDAGLLSRFFLESKNLPANSLLVLDEIDKIPVRCQYPPANTLYSLLEPSTAKRFWDNHLELEMDFSRLNIIATANRPEAIDPAIYSRFNVVYVDALMDESLFNTYHSIYLDLLDEYGIEHQFCDELSISALKQLRGSTPRNARKRLLAAISHCAAKYTRTKSKADLEVTAFTLKKY